MRNRCLTLEASKVAFRILQDTVNARIQGDTKFKTIMTFLGLYGPQSIPSIQKNINALCKKVEIQNPNPIPDCGINLERSEIERKIELLKKSGLIQEPDYYFHKTSTRILALTFKGLIWYFREPPALSKGKIIRFFESY